MTPNNQPFVSYAQNFEDVMLWRALEDVQNGFYVDVGAYLPVTNSVTKAFYDRGWRGINIEPIGTPYRKLAENRPRDINLQIAVGQSDQETVLYEIKDGLSTLNPEVAQSHREDGYQVTESSIRVKTLNAIFEEHVRSSIHFLKIDVEGHEKEVLQGIDFSHWRPWIILVESTIPNTEAPNFSVWEELILGSSYHHVYFDGLNRFYVADEHHGLDSSFSKPPNVFDNFVSHRFHEAQVSLAEKKDRIGQLAQELRAHLERLTAAQDRVLDLQNQLNHYKDTHHRELEAKNKEIFSLHEQLLNAKNEISSREQKIISLQDQLSQMEDRISSTEEKMGLLNDKVGSLEHQLSLQEEELAQKIRTLEEKEEQIRSLKNQRDDLSNQLHSTRDELRQLSQSADFYISKYHELLQSRSWKMTAPLRWVGRVFKKLSGWVALGSVKRSLFHFLQRSRNHSRVQPIADRFRAQHLDFWNRVKGILISDTSDPHAEEPAPVAQSVPGLDDDTAYFVDLFRRKHQEQNQGMI